MREVAFGTAHLYGLVPVQRSDELLASAWAAGVRRYDTAPSYGGGLSEVRLGAFLRDRSDSVVVTTKAGLVAPAGPADVRRLAKQAAGLLPEGLRQRLRGKVHAASQGHFGTQEVRSTVETSLSRLGNVDRLLLHEVLPEQVTGELVELLRRYVARGDVRQVGVATRNAHTLAALARAPELFTVAHIEAGPLSGALALPLHVTVRVGHGLLGPGGTHLQALRRVLCNDADLAARWSQLTQDSAYAGPDGLALAVLGRPGPERLDEVIVATSRPGAVAPACAHAAAAGPLPAGLEDLLDRLVGAIDVATISADRPD